MTAAPYSDGVVRLALAPDALRSRTLLKAATELFAYEPRHGRAEIAVYEELALQLVRTTPLEDRIRVADILAGHADAPPALLAILIADVPAVAAPILARSAVVTDLMLLALVASGSPDHLALVAERPGLSDDVVEALVRKMAPDQLPRLIANPTIRIPEPLVPGLVALARGRPELAAALARRHDIDEAELTDLFLDLDDRGRRRVLQSLEILALRDFAARRPLPRSPRPDPDVVAELARASLSRDVDRTAERLAIVVGIEPALARRLLTDRGGEALSIALKSAGLDGATVTRVILFSGAGDVRDYFEVKRLVELSDRVSMRSAMLLVGRWRGDAAPLPARPPRSAALSPTGPIGRRVGEAVAAGQAPGVSRQVPDRDTRLPARARQSL